MAWAQDYGGTTGYAWDTQQSPNVRLVAAYEYDPYGNITAQSGAYAGSNPFRFSTKYYDTQTGLGYWGYRYYSPGLGRWISRDPIGERGGLNLQAYGHNEPVDAVDVLGLCASCCCVKKLEFKKIKDIGTEDAFNLDTGYGHRFEVVVNLQFHTARTNLNESGGACTLEWWEYTDYPLTGLKGAKKDTWYDAYAIHTRGSHKLGNFKEWDDFWSKPTIPCDGEQAIALPDEPLIKTAAKASIAQKLRIIVRVHSAKNCICNMDPGTQWVESYIEVKGGMGGERWVRPPKTIDGWPTFTHKTKRPPFLPKWEDDPRWIK